MYKILNKEQPLFKPEEFGGQHPKYHNSVLSVRIPGDGKIHHHTLILLEWYLDLEQIQS